jgi:hypothetical protein
MAGARSVEGSDRDDNTSVSGNRPSRANATIAPPSKIGCSLEVAAGISPNSFGASPMVGCWSASSNDERFDAAVSRLPRCPLGGRWRVAVEWVLCGAFFLMVGLRSSLKHSSVHCAALNVRNRKVLGIVVLGRGRLVINPDDILPCCLTLHCVAV